MYFIDRVLRKVGNEYIDKVGSYRCINIVVFKVRAHTRLENQQITRDTILQVFSSVVITNVSLNVTSACVYLGVLFGRTLSPEDMCI